MNAIRRIVPPQLGTRVEAKGSHWSASFGNANLSLRKRGTQCGERCFGNYGYSRFIIRDDVVPRTLQKPCWSQMALPKVSDSTRRRSGVPAQCVETYAWTAIKATENTLTIVAKPYSLDFFQIFASPKFGAVGRSVRRDSVPVVSTDTKHGSIRRHRQPVSSKVERRRESSHISKRCKIPNMYNGLQFRCCENRSIITGCQMTNRGHGESYNRCLPSALPRPAG
jgi:hypothetical protein